MERYFKVSYRINEEGNVLASIYSVPGCHAEGATREEARARVITNLAYFFENVPTDTIIDDE